MKKILFIDRDGTLIKEPSDFQVDDLSKVRLAEDVIPSLLKLRKADFELVMISNQDGLGTASFASADFQICHDFIVELFASQDINFREIFICPHFAEDNCLCRKPKTGLLDEFLRNNAIDMRASFVIGDRDSDRLLAENLGLSFLAINPNQGWKAVSNSILTGERSAKVQRKTNETEVSLRLSLGNSAPAATKITTPIPFFTHMLEQLAHHGGFSLELQANGDMPVDDHHLIEDVAITLGEALRTALGDKSGIGRYGFTLPMDESLATVAIDLSGRSFCSFEHPFTREYVGGMATEMVAHFFKSFSDGLKASLHIKVAGENHHHMVEACFKSLGRALRSAVSVQDKDASLPSTKGIL